MRKISWIIVLLCGFSMICHARIQEHVVLYPSVDRRGDSLLLSGKITIPERPIKGIILLSHYTIGADKEVPSNCIPPEARQLKKEYILVMPDYLGYGATKDRFPPYLDGELTAHHCVDMLLYARSFLDSIQVAFPSDLYLVGFSQGAAVALWTLQRLETLYAQDFEVKRCFAGSGPYDVATTFDDAVARNKVGMPMVVPLLVMGTSTAYDLNLQQEDFFTPSTEQCFDEYIASKKYSVLSLFSRMPSHRLDKWLNEKGRDKTQPATQQLYAGFMQSSLVHFDITDTSADSVCPSWTPRTPVYIFHSYDDDVVCFHNAEHLHRCFVSEPNIVWDFGHYGGHLTSLITFFSRVHKAL